MNMKYCTAVLLVLTTAGCASQSQDVYDFKEAGQSTLVEFGTVLKTRPIEIKGESTGVGAIGGGIAGAAAGSQLGGGDGRVYTALGGVLVGAVAGAVAEQAIQDKKGIEYTIITEKGKVLTVPQYLKSDEPVFSKGARVIVQTSGSYQRVLTADDLPTEVKRPKGIKVVD